MDQGDHWIELTPGELARTGYDEWYFGDGPGQYQGQSGVDCLEFSVSLHSYKPPPRFEVIRVDVICGKRRVKLYRLVKETKDQPPKYDNSVHEIWVQCQPSPTALSDGFPTGTYQIKIHYRLGDKEYDAEWNCVYKAGPTVAPWQLPRCMAPSRQLSQLLATLSVHQWLNLR